MCSHDPRLNAATLRPSRTTLMRARRKRWTCRRSREREKEFLSPPPDWALIWLLRFPQFKKFLYLYNIYRVYIIFCVIFLNVAFFLAYVNDPSAGSPTETLLRLLLPLNDQVWSSSRHNRQRKITLPRTSPKTSLNHSIGSSDGRCVQRAGT